MRPAARWRKRQLAMLLLLALLAGLPGRAAPLSAAPHYHLALRPLGDTGLYHGILALGEQPVTGICELEFASAGWRDALALSQVPVGSGHLVVESAERNLLDESAPAELRVRCRGEDDSLQAAELGALPPPPAPGPVTGRSYQRVISVAPTGADFTSIQAAIDSVHPEPGERYLVRVAAGVYREWVFMHPFVDVEGAGEARTVLAARTDGKPLSWATVTGAPDAELRDLTVENHHPAENVVAINLGGLGTRLARVTAIASGGRNFSIAISAPSAPAALEGTTALAMGSPINLGLHTAGSASPRVVSSLAIAWGGTTLSAAVYNEASEVSLHASVAIAGGSASTNAGIINLGGAPTLNDTVALASGGLAPRAVYALGAQLSAARITAVAVGGENGFGLYNDRESISTVAGGTLEVGGTATNYAVYNVGTASLGLSDATVRAWGGAGNTYGLYNGPESRMAITSSLLHVAGGGSAYGVYSTTDAAAHLRDVRILAAGGRNENIGVHGDNRSHLVVTGGQIAAEGGQLAVGVQVIYGGNAELLQARIAASAGQEATYGVRTEVNTVLTLSEASVTATGGRTATGIYDSYASQTVLRAVTVTASAGETVFGLRNVWANPVVANVRILAADGTHRTVGVSNQGSAARLTAVTIRARGQTSGTFGLENLVLSESILEHVVISSTGSIDAYGVFNYLASPMMEHVTVTVSGASRDNKGFFDFGGYTATLRHVNVAAYGGSTATAIHLIGMRPPVAPDGLPEARPGLVALEYVTATASGASQDNRGFLGYRAYTATLRHVDLAAYGGARAIALEVIGMRPSVAPDSGQTLPGLATLEYITATASTATENIGISIGESIVTLTHARTTAWHGVASTGLSNRDGAQTSLNDVTVSASGGLTVLGIFNRDAPEPAMTHVTIDVHEGLLTMKRLILGGPSDDP